MINLKGEEEKLDKAVKIAEEKEVILPTFSQMKDPEKIPDEIKNRLEDVGLWEIHPLNLFRITWKNEATRTGGLYDGVNCIELPSSLTGVNARIIALVGKWFPTGAHKVGATYGCLVPELVTGQFDPAEERAVWPSTGNYCRGGAYNSRLLGCKSIAILPEGMSRERFEWLSGIADEVIKTPGSESNIKEIFDKCHELEENRDDIKIFNQFDELGNHLWHYEVTGEAMLEAFSSLAGDKKLKGVVLTSGSAGTLGSADRVKEEYPPARLAVGEALQCPTLLYNGYGAHRIEGIGDKHVPWVHNVRNTDMVMGIDDRDAMNLIRLFNTEVGRNYLVDEGVPEETIENLDLLGISSIANMLGAIKFARYYELGEEDVIMTVFTDSMELYESRVEEMASAGKYGREQAAVDFHKCLQGQNIDHIQELSYYEKKRIHNLKYYTWIEQQGREVEELNAQWYDHEDYWGDLHDMTEEIDNLIEKFNKRSGLLEELT